MLVVGAGPAGAAVALGLTTAGRSVVLVNRAPRRPRVGELLPPLVVPLLARLRLRDRFLADGHLPSPRSCSVWGSDRPHETDLSMHPYGPAWHVDRARFDSMLLRAAQDGGATVADGHRLRAFGRDGGRWEVETAGADGTARWTASFLIDATGRASALARRCGVRRRANDRLVGAVTILSTANDARPATGTLVEATGEGWWYSGQLPGGRSVAAYMTDADLLSGPRELEAFWHDRLLAAPATAARAAGRDGTPRVVRAESSRLERVVGPGWVAVGDAALGVDPLAAQGVCFALTSAERAAHGVDRSLAGDASGLEDYARSCGEEYARYLTARALYYEREDRWAASPFWRRRRGPPGVSD